MLVLANLGFGRFGSRNACAVYRGRRRGEDVSVVQLRKEDAWKLRYWSRYIEHGQR
jgi:hypothetical protein